MVDALATLSTMVQVNEGQEMTIHPRVAHYQHLSHGEAEVDDEPWYFDIERYLEQGEYPEGVSENDKRTLRSLASDFFLSEMTLYKRNSDMMSFWCVDHQEAKRIIEEVHEGTFGIHSVAEVTPLVTDERFWDTEPAENIGLKKVHYYLGIIGSGGNGFYPS
ncbi:hypothetical protein CR513_56606, partial [Mucuna pruriens]